MSNLAGQCLKSAVDIESIFDTANDNSPSFNYTINAGKKLLFLFSKDTPLDFIYMLLDKCNNKAVNAIIPEDYTVSEYDYFGITNARVPIMIDKAFLQADTVISVSVINYHNILGFTGGKSLIFPGIAPLKAKQSLFQLSLDETTFYKDTACKAGVLKDNPVSNDITDALMVINQNVRYFGINLILDDNGDIANMYCGDIFLSHIEAASYFAEKYPIAPDKEYRGLILNLTRGSLQEKVDIIEQASPFLVNGGRMFINGLKLSDFGSATFKETFNTPHSEDIFKQLLGNFTFDAYYALILKKLCQIYHISIVSYIENDIIKQTGLNPIEITDRDAFLKDCGVVGEIYETNGRISG